VQPGEIIVGFFGDAIKFIRHQTVLSGLTHLSRHAVTSLKVRMRSITYARQYIPLAIDSKRLVIAILYTLFRCSTG